MELTKQLKTLFEVVDETHCFKVVDGTDEAVSISTAK
ncbi:Uncharacterised protein [Streptococcus pneumoniae]|nr:Uncharacterised protein [Streptococcus pneumoniae]